MILSCQLTVLGPAPLARVRGCAAVLGVLDATLPGGCIPDAENSVSIKTRG